VREVSFAVVALLAACSSRGPSTPSTSAAPSGHITTWDAELAAVVGAIEKLEPTHRLHVGGTGRMSIRVISHAVARPEDRPALEAGDTCSASSRGIVCTERALATLVTSKALPVNPVLLFVIAHELGHIVHGDAGNFTAPPIRIEAGASASEIDDAVRGDVCATPDVSEERADEFARGIVGRAVGAGVFSDGAADLGRVAVTVVNVMFEAAIAASTGGDASTATLLESASDTSEAGLDTLAQQVLCLIRPEQPREVVWQGFPGGYHVESVRLTRVADTLTTEIAAGGYGLAAHAGNLPELLQSLVGIQRALARQHSEAVTGVAKRMCDRFQQAADPWKDLCDDDVPSANALPACPVLHSRAKDSTTGRAVPGAAPMTTRGNELSSTEPVTSIVAVGGRDVVVAIGDRGRVASWSPGGVTMIGDAGCRVGGLADSTTERVAVCASGESVVRFERATNKATTTRYEPFQFDGESLPSDQVRISWAGTRNNRDLAAVHLLGSGRGVLVEVTANAIASVAAWASAPCEDFAVRVTETNGELWAAPASHLIEPQLLRVSNDLSRVTTRITPETVRVDRAVEGDPRGNVPFMTCHPSIARGLRVCVAMDGRVVDAVTPFGPVLGQIDGIEQLVPGQFRVRSCGSSKADYMLVTEPSQARVFEVSAGSRKARLAWRHDGESDDADLVCGGDVAVVVVNRRGAAKVARLEPRP
jgi:hypothetical protein